MEALRRCKYKFPGRQKIVISNKWGFTSMTRPEYLEARAQGKLMPDGCYIKMTSTKGKLDDYFDSVRRTHR